MPHPDDPAFYRQRAALVAERGYAASAMQAPPKWCSRDRRHAARGRPDHDRARRSTQPGM